MKIELEWRIPFDVPEDKREAAVDKLVKYLNDGTIFESKRRMIGHAVAVKPTGTKPRSQALDDPYIIIELEN